MIDILFVGGLKGLRSRLDNNLYKFLKYLIDNSKFKIKWIEDINKVKQLLDNYDPSNKKLIVYQICCNYKLYNYSDKIINVLDVFDINCKCHYKCDGTGKCNIKNYYNKLKYDYYIFKYYTYLTKNILHESKIFFMGHYVDPNIYYDRKLEKKYDILFYGNAILRSYPFRNKLLEIFRRNKRKLNIKIIEFSRRKRYSKTLPHNEELSKLINQSWITISTKAVSNFLLQRYYEIAMSNSTICGDYPDLEKDTVIKDNMIKLNINMSEDQILDIIEKNLKNKDKLKEMSKKCYDHYHKYYTYEEGSKKLENIFEKILNH